MSTDLSPAVARGMKLFTETPIRELPVQARILAAYMCSKYMMCGEVLLTAYCYYAQLVEDLACDDEAYRVTPQAREDWEAAQRDWELATVDGRTFARPKAPT